MSAIGHASEARKHIEWAHEQQQADGEFDFSVRDNAILAQAEATLALVEEQRTANLIAAFERDALTPPHISSESNVPWWNQVAAEITKRLGLS